MAGQGVLLLNLAIASGAAAEAATRKRGFSGFLGKATRKDLGEFTCEDAALLNLHDSWHYTWRVYPTEREYPGEENRCPQGGTSVSSEFVPMTIGVKCPVNGSSCAPTLSKYVESIGTPEVLSIWKQANARFLLGYNEPDIGNGHNVSDSNHGHAVLPADAAAAWPKVQALARSMSPPLTLVSPSVASTQESGGKDSWDENGHSTWMDNFFGNCSDVVSDCDPSLIKFIGMHDYHGSVDGLRRRVDGAYKRYGRMVWLTEVGWTYYGNPPTREMNDAYMKELLPFLDSSESVFRYAWYTARNSPGNQNGGSNLLALDGSTMLTSTGEIYKVPLDVESIVV